MATGLVQPEESETMQPDLGTILRNIDFKEPKGLRLVSNNSQPRNLFNILADFTFADQQGNIISGDKLQELTGNRRISLGFFFPGCGRDNHEILTHQRAYLDRMTQPDTVANVIINTNSYSSVLIPGDLKHPVNQSNRDSFLKELTGNPPNPFYPRDTRYLREENTVILYPLQQGGHPIKNQAQMEQVIKDITLATGGVATGLPTKSGKPAHNSRISAYEANGDEIISARTGEPLEAAAKYIEPGEWAETFARSDNNGKTESRSLAR